MILLLSGSSQGWGMIPVWAGNGCPLLVHMGSTGYRAVGSVTYVPGLLTASTSNFFLVSSGNTVQEVLILHSILLLTYSIREEKHNV